MRETIASALLGIALGLVSWTILYPQDAMSAIGGSLVVFTAVALVAPLDSHQPPFHTLTVPERNHLTMASTFQTIEAGVLGAIINASNANQTTLETYIASGEAGVQAGVANLVKNIPSVKGALSLVVAPIQAAVESEIQAYVASIIAKETPQTLFAIYIALLTNLQTEALK